MKIDTLTCEVGTNTVQVIRRDAETIEAPNSIYARVIRNDGNSVYIEEEDAVRILELMHMLEEVISKR